MILRPANYRLGWGSLCVAAGGAYYFAKQGINADRQAKMEEMRRKRQMIQSLEYGDNISKKPSSASAIGSTNGGPARTDPSGSPSQEAASDPAPTGHAPATERDRVFEKSKYESSTPFRSPKGDRFS